MKTALFTKEKISVHLLMVLFLLLIAPSIFAQNAVPSDFNQKCIANLNVGIQSENKGLRTSSVYLSGFYSLKECVPTLVEQLSKEKNPNVKILIALALYKIGDEKGIAAVKNLAMNDNNPEVKRMGKAILAEFSNERNLTTK